MFFHKECPELSGNFFFLCSSRNMNLLHINTTLREQLEQATNANQKLSNELQTMNHEWVLLRGQLEIKEREWRDEETVRLITEQKSYSKLKIIYFPIFQSLSTSISHKNMENYWIYGAQWFQWSAIWVNWNRQLNAIYTKSKPNLCNQQGMCKTHATVYRPMSKQTNPKPRYLRFSSCCKPFFSEFIRAHNRINPFLSYLLSNSFDIFQRISKSIMKYQVGKICTIQYVYRWSKFPSKIFFQYNLLS